MNDIFKMFFYLENHLDWKIRVDYYIYSISGFCEKTGVFSLKFVNPGKSITASLGDMSIEFFFFGPNNFIKKLEISCQEGFYIKVYENNNINSNVLNSKEDILHIKSFFYNDFLSLYRKYCFEKSSKLFNSLLEENNDLFFSNKSKVYLFSNEPLNLLFGEKAFFDELNDKSIFSITGSGDFFFNARLFGAKEIMLLDINKYSLYYFEIKKALIKKYTYKDFINIYKNIDNIYYKFKEYSHFIRDDIRKKIVNEFSIYSDNVSSFIENVFWSDSFEFDNFENMNRRINFFTSHNSYLADENSYNKLRTTLLTDDINIKMCVSSLLDFDFSNVKKYDYIYLSNIGDYCDVVELSNLLTLLINNNLNSYGKIILIYRTDNYKYLLDNFSFKIDKYYTSFDSSMNNVILYCSLT